MLRGRQDRIPERLTRCQKQGYPYIKKPRLTEIDDKLLLIFCDHHDDHPPPFLRRLLPRLLLRPA